MKTIVSLAACCSLIAVPASAAAKKNTQIDPKPRVELKTNFGRIVIELDADRAPRTVKNFLRYVSAKHYDGTIFHRVIENFLIQAGGYTSSMRRKKTRSELANEADNGLKNLRGTVAMARPDDPHGATAQFFINVTNNRFLDHVSKTDSQSWGYTVFGRVVAGMDVVDKIRRVKTGPRDPFWRAVPVEDVVILAARSL